jgi:hypothetical protein
VDTYTHMCMHKNSLPLHGSTLSMPTQHKVFLQIYHSTTKQGSMETHKIIHEHRLSTGSGPNTQYTVKELRTHHKKQPCMAQSLQQITALTGMSNLLAEERKMHVTVDTYNNQHQCTHVHTCTCIYTYKVHVAYDLYTR